MKKALIRSKSSRVNLVAASAIATSIVIVGYTLYTTLAAPAVNVEPGQATPSGTASIAQSAEASGGSFLQFGSEPVTPRPPVDEGEVIWSSTFENNSFDDWRYMHSSGRYEIVTNPVREGRYAAKLTSDAGGGSSNRAQLDGPLLFGEGSESYIGWSTFFPSNFIDPPNGTWFLFFQFHASPFGESPPLAFEAEAGKLQMTHRGAANTYWETPISKNRWIDFVVHVKWSKNPNTGFAELWVDGEPQTFKNGSTRVNFSTILPRADENVFPIATVYYQGGKIGPAVTVFHDAIRVGTSYEAVRPK